MKCMIDPAATFCPLTVPGGGASGVSGRGVACFFQQVFEGGHWGAARSCVWGSHFHTHLHVMYDLLLVCVKIFKA